METLFYQGNHGKSHRLFHTPSTFARKNLIYPQEIGTLIALNAHPSGRKNLSSYLFFIIESGEGTLTYQNVIYHLQTGDAIFIDCRNPYIQCSGNDLWTLKWCHFYGPPLDELYKEYINRGGKPAFHVHNPEKINQLLGHIYATMQTNHATKEIQLYAYLTDLISQLFDESFRQTQYIGNNTKKKNLSEIHEYLKTHYTEKITLDYLSEHYFINKYYLTRIFKDQYGISITGYLLELRLTKAKHLLRFTDYSIEEISQQVGIDDANYFARVFRKTEGISPGEYRKHW